MRTVGIGTRIYFLKKYNVKNSFFLSPRQFFFYFRLPDLNEDTFGKLTANSVRRVDAKYASNVQRDVHNV